MADLRYEMLKALKGKLSSISSTLKVFSDIPSSYPHPFIFLGDITVEEIQNKSNFLYRGIVTIELYTGTTGWQGSIKEPIGWLNSINTELKSSKSEKLDIANFNISVWNLTSNTGLQNISTTEKLYTGVIQYRYEATPSV